MADEEEEKPHIVIDNGSYYIKAGFSGDEGPKTIFRNIIGRMKYKKTILTLVVMKRKFL